jgi:hypothetical protein
VRRRLTVICILAAAGTLFAASGAGAAPSATPASTTVHVSPAVGGVRTTFRVRFSIPQATGTTGGVRRTASLVISGPHRSGCAGSAGVALSAAAAHHTFHVALRPASAHARWCPGTFRGRLMETEAPACPPGPVTARPTVMCPLYIVAPRVLARFRFRVTAASAARW